MKVVLTAHAERDLEAIADWIAQDSPRAAVEVVKRLRKACTNLGPYPLAYAIEPRFAEFGYRKRVVGPYLVFYRVAETVKIVRILHGARDYDAALAGED
ncbi:MAG: type II toxin-antitoxin system RelE/ParE family toxin [Alphaproteobacteria bacterium]|nr:type II toxin-antitoxin system RelE/ParE family toxin [Alphaproteobacteria bacterium]